MSKKSGMNITFTSFTLSPLVSPTFTPIGKGKAPETQISPKALKDVSFHIPFKPSISQEAGNAVLKEHLFCGKHLPQTPAADYPNGLTKAAVISKWLKMTPDNNTHVEQVKFSSMLLRGM